MVVPPLVIALLDALEEPALLVAGERTLAANNKDLDQLDAYIEAGATHIILGLGAPFDLKPVEQLITWRDGKNT